MWKLPEDFNPDGGVRFAPVIYDDEREIRRAPVGTNLLTAAQAEAMVRNMLEDLPEPDDGDECPMCGICP